VRLRGVDAEVIRLGLDLDLTLIDTRDAARVGLKAVNEVFDDRLDIEEMIGRMGPPLRSELARFLPDDDADRAIEVYRTAFLNEGVSFLQPLPGAQSLFDRSRSMGAFVAVLTARIPSTAFACLDECQLKPDQLIGDVVGSGKAPGIRELQLEAFVGDHPLDMEAASVAGVPGIGVTTGHHTAEELIDAGAEIAVASLPELFEQ
jgi:phosphoglycolate phosphatase